jgi:hypothetical protein
MFMKYPIFCSSPSVICIILFQLIVISCASDSGKVATLAEIIKLDEPKILIHYEDNHLVSPMVLKTTAWDELLVYDSRLGVVKVFDGEGKLRAEFGERGQGPGEYQRVGSVALFDDNVYLIDDFGFAIHKFHFDSNGNYNFQDSFTYDPAGTIQFPPLPPMPAPDLTYVENLFAANTLSVPHMAGLNILLIPSILDEKWLYDLTYLDGSFQGGIGKLPKEGIPELNYEMMRRAVSQREIPILFTKTAFPVTDKKNPEELFLVSYAASNITKINLSQNKEIWKTDVSGLSEIDEIKNNYFKTAVAITNQADAIIPFFAYTRGISTQSGDLYLSTYTTSELSMWIHKFNNNGELQSRYRLSSEFELLPTFEVDTIRGRFLTITRDGEILAFYY